MIDTYVNEVEGLVCDECMGIIPVGVEFKVVTTPSKPYKNNCLRCADKRLESEKHAWSDNEANVAHRDKQAARRLSNRLAREEKVRAAKRANRR